MKKVETKCSRCNDVGKENTSEDTGQPNDPMLGGVSGQVFRATEGNDKEPLCGKLQGDRTSQHMSFSQTISASIGDLHGCRGYTK